MPGAPQCLGLGAHQGVARPACHRGGGPGGFRGEIVDVDHAGDEPDPQRGGGVDGPAGEAEVAGGTGPHQVGQGGEDDVGPALFGVTEACLGGRHPDVAHHGEVEAAGQRRALHGGHCREREPQDGVVEAVRGAPQALLEAGLVHGEFRQVEPGAERVSRRRQDHTAHALVGCEAVQDVAQLVAQGDRQGILLLGPVDDDRHDALVDLRHPDQLTHAPSPSPLCMTVHGMGKNRVVTTPRTRAGSDVASPR